MKTLLRSLMDDENMRETYEAAVIQVATRDKMADAIAGALMTSDVIIAPIARFAASQVKKEVSTFSQGPIAMAPPSFSPSGDSSSSAKDNKRKNRRPKKKVSKNKNSPESSSGSDSCTCSRRGSIKKRISSTKDSSDDS